MMHGFNQELLPYERKLSLETKARRDRIMAVLGRSKYFAKRRNWDSESEIAYKGLPLAYIWSAQSAESTAVLGEWSPE